MAENVPDNEVIKEHRKKFEELTWQEQFGVSWKTPLGLFGVGLTTVSFTLLILGLFGHVAGLIENQYASIITFMVFPAGVLLGLILIPVAYYMRRKRWFRGSLASDKLILDFGNKYHRRAVSLFIVLTVVNVAVFGVFAYEAYHFTDSNYFCGTVCHTVMDNSYTVYQRSGHARVKCVECHIGSGAKWYVKAKLSGLRQVWAVMTNSYHVPIATPIQDLRPARDICEECHWPEKFYGQKVKKFIEYSNTDQLNPDVTELALNIGGPNPFTDEFEGIHWHVSNNVQIEYHSLNRERTLIGKIRVTDADGEERVYDYDGSDGEEEEGEHWRVMDCLDCHNLTSHLYGDLEVTVDNGIYAKKLDGEIPGIREDSMTVLTKSYEDRAKAQEGIKRHLFELQAKRNGAEFISENGTQLSAAADYLLASYMGNVWPKMKVTWGTYKAHNGHQYEDDGYGCFRCHNDSHETEDGDYIEQDCELCHDYPD
ncbi:NapC/NirT family cytochrome c [Desulfosediminicola ganghwensis]|uniref:NapC/NirT family cytochrome c n=1 Tax=Desulfosediminicola ganghwensis TaxID=2569540 RepID=UPI0010ACFDA7|nr:NapC/NirT family cytochrome c [Desulfosediminicola ganghwensis]